MKKMMLWSFASATAAAFIAYYAVNAVISLHKQTSQSECTIAHDAQQSQLTTNKEISTAALIESEKFKELDYAFGYTTRKNTNKYTQDDSKFKSRNARSAIDWKTAYEVQCKTRMSSASNKQFASRKIISPLPTSNGSQHSFVQQQASGQKDNAGDSDGSESDSKSVKHCAVEAGCASVLQNELKCKNKWGSVSIRHKRQKSFFNDNHKVKFAKEKVDSAIGAYDISIMDGNNVKWQPSSDGVEVEVVLSEPLATKYKNLGLVHYLSNGKTEVVKTASFRRNASGAVESFAFTANSFSIYAIVNTDGELVVPRRFYHFYGHTSTNGAGFDVALPYQFKDQSNDFVNVQIVKDGDFLKEPPIPSDIIDENGEVLSMFEGWYVVATNERPSGAVESKLDNLEEYFQFRWPVGGTDLRMSFTNSVHVTETNDWDYWVVPLYENARFLQFNENANGEIDEGIGARIIRRKLVAINNEISDDILKVSDVEAALKNGMNEYFCGWEYLDVDGQYKQLLVYSDAGKRQDQFITVNDALFEMNGGSVIQLYPYYVSAHFLHFNANAKSVDFVGSLFVRSTSNFKQVDVSGNRKGYDFGGWQAGFYDEDTKELRLGIMVTDANGNFIPNLTITNTFTGEISFTTDAQGNIRMNEDVTLYGTWVANSSAPYRVIVWQQRVTDSKDAMDSEKTYYYVTHYTSPEVPATTQISESLLTSFTGTAASGSNPNRANLTALSGKNNITGEDFTGFRYGRFECSDATVASDGSTVINIYYDRKLMTFTFGGSTTRTGLYGQSFDWPNPPSGYLWQYTYDGTTSYMTFMDAFIPPSGDYDMTFTSSRVNNMTSSVAFYKQQFDGTYLEIKTISMQSGRFSITDKFNGFHAAKYRNGNGSEVQLGSKDSSGNYATVQTSGNTTLHIYFDRNNYEIIYKYIDDDGNGEEHVVYDTGKVVPYESPLSNYNYAHTNSLLYWSECDIANRTFEGWYEDASLTKEFDFNATMPDGKKIIYARWAPVKHRVIIDPNGGELLPNEATWFYVDPSKDETIEEYTPTRKYRLDLHTGTFYYHYDPYDPVKDKHTDQYDPATSNAPRRAYYTEDISEATSNEFSNTENRYTYDPSAYAFMGWFEVLPDGTLATDPFSFSEPPTGPVTLRAIWRRLGVYTLKYESIDPDGIRATETIYDPQKNSTGNTEDGYVADAETTLVKIPTNYNKDEWIWEGWQAIDTFNNNIPLTAVRSPGDIYVVKPIHADINNVIHFRAVYKRSGDSSSRHIPRVTDLILDSNENAVLADGAEFDEIVGRVGIYTNGVADGYDGLNQGVWFAGQQNNFSVALADYTDKFTHNNGYFLLGWDIRRNLDSMIPAYYANEIIGVDIGMGDENILYAIWEPQIYIEFINDTGAALNGVQLYIPAWAEGDIFRVNSVKDTYKREKFTAFANGQATFNIEANEKICLVLPDGADKMFTAGGTCAYAEGTKLVVTMTETDGIVKEKVVYSGENFTLDGTMKISQTPVQVRFTNETYATTADVPVRYFLHEPDGVITEITSNSGSWSSYGSVKRTLSGIGSANNDIAMLLRKSSSEGVHEYLVQSISEQYGYTTIGIGAATGDFNEWRSISNGEPSGGSYVRFYHEKVEWSKYSEMWNAYDNAAVYVVFYKRIPVQFTIGKNVNGSDEDRASRTFNFNATFEEHSKTIEFKEVIVWRRTRGWSGWGNPTVYSMTTNGFRIVSTDDKPFSTTRNPETFNLGDSDDHSITLYFNRDESSTDSITEWESTGGWGLTEERTQTITYRVTYQYEDMIVQESDSSDFALTAISHQSGSIDFSARTYSISSKKDIAGGYSKDASSDDAIFTNTRKTGSIKISKTVSGTNEGCAFPFTLTLSETVVGKDTYVVPQGVTIAPSGKILAFSLKNNESVTIPNLPAGASYTVEEGVNDKYIATVPGNAVGDISESETIVNFINTRKAEITIEVNKVESKFNGEEQRGYEVSTIDGNISEAYGVTGLPSGHVLTVERYVVPKGIEVGTYTGRVENARFTVTSNNVDVTSRFIINMTPGILEIKRMAIVIEVTGNTTSATYDGTEHVCRGYTYVIKDSDTGEVITNDNILVSVDPNYQQAYQTNVGKTEMHLDGHVNVIVPDGFELQDVVIARNGYMEITPKAVVVTANDTSKMPGVEDPDYTATVDGLIGDDTIEFTVERTEAGEEVGQEYSIVLDGETEQGNYTVTYVAGKLKIENPSLIQRANGEAVPVEVTIPAELLSELGIENTKGVTPEAVNNILNSVDSNGLMRWENIRLGLDTNEPPLSVGSDDPITGTLEVGTPDPTNKQTDLGYDVMYELWKYVEQDTSDSSVDDVWELKAGPVHSKNELTIQLVDENGNSKKPTGLYRVVTLIIPDSRMSITNEILSENIIGVLEIESQHTNTIVAVPWKKLASDPLTAVDVTVSNHVSAVNLSVEDSIYALADNDTYYSWTLNENGIWQDGDTHAVSPDNTHIVSESSPAADNIELSRANAVWVHRAEPIGENGECMPFFIIGQYETNSVDIIVNGGTAEYTLMSVPDYHDYCINDIDWSGYASVSDSRDFIYVVQGSQSFLLKWNGEAWCVERVKYRTIAGRTRPAGSELVLYDTPLKAGTGFWFCRHGSEFTIKWTPLHAVE